MGLRRWMVKIRWRLNLASDRSSSPRWRQRIRSKFPLTDRHPSQSWCFHWIIISNLMQHWTLDPSMALPTLCEIVKENNKEITIQDSILKLLWVIGKGIQGRPKRETKLLQVWQDPIWSFQGRIRDGNESAMRADLRWGQICYEGGSMMRTELRSGQIRDEDGSEANFRLTDQVMPEASLLLLHILEQLQIH